MGNNTLERELERIVEPVVERVVERLLAGHAPQDPEEFVSVKTAARRLDIPEDTIRKWLQRGVIKKYKIRGCVRVRLAEMVKTDVG